jgi:hypothetical protein
VRFEILIGIRQLQDSDIGSVVPHPVPGYIWVTLGTVKPGIFESGGALALRKKQGITEGYVKIRNSREVARMLFDALIT